MRRGELISFPPTQQQVAKARGGTQRAHLWCVGRKTPPESREGFIFPTKKATLKRHTAASDRKKKNKGETPSSSGATKQRLRPGSPGASARDRDSAHSGLGLHPRSSHRRWKSMLA